MGVEAFAKEVVVTTVSTAMILALILGMIWWVKAWWPTLKRYTNRYTVSGALVYLMILWLCFKYGRGYEGYALILGTVILCGIWSYMKSFASSNASQNSGTAELQRATPDRDEWEGRRTGMHS